MNEKKQHGVFQFKQIEWRESTFWRIRKCQIGRGFLKDMQPNSPLSLPNPNSFKHGICLQVRDVRSSSFQIKVQFGRYTRCCAAKGLKNVVKHLAESAVDLQKARNSKSQGTRGPSCSGEGNHACSRTKDKKSHAMPPDKLFGGYIHHARTILKFSPKSHTEHVYNII